MDVPSGAPGRPQQQRARTQTGRYHVPLCLDARQMLSISQVDPGGAGCWPLIKHHMLLATLFLMLAHVSKISSIQESTGPLLVQNHSGDMNQQQDRARRPEDLPPASDANNIKYILTPVYLIIFAIGVGGNICNCLVIADSRNRYMKTATNYYLFSLSISDLLLLIFGIPHDLVNLWHPMPYLFSQFVCVFRGWVSEASTYASVLVIVAFSVERYLAICHPLRVHTLSRLSRSVKIIILIWLVASSCAMMVVNQFGIQETFTEVIVEVEDPMVAPEGQAQARSAAWTSLEHSTGAALTSGPSGSLEATSNPLDTTASITAYKKPTRHRESRRKAIAQCTIVDLNVKVFELSVLIFFIIPMTVITILYMKLGYHLRQKTTQIKQNRWQRERQMSQRYNHDDHHDSNRDIKVDDSINKNNLHTNLSMAHSSLAPQVLGKTTAFATKHLHDHIHIERLQATLRPEKSSACNHDKSREFKDFSCELTSDTMTTINPESDMTEFMNINKVLTDVAKEPAKFPEYKRQHVKIRVISESGQEAGTETCKGNFRDHAKRGAVTLARCCFRSKSNKNHQHVLMSGPFYEDVRLRELGSDELGGTSRGASEFGSLGRIAASGSVPISKPIQSSSLEENQNLQHFIESPRHRLREAVGYERVEIDTNNSTSNSGPQSVGHHVGVLKSQTRFLPNGKASSMNMIEATQSRGGSRPDSDAMARNPQLSITDADQHPTAAASNSPAPMINHCDIESTGALNIILGAELNKEGVAREQCTNFRVREKRAREYLITETRRSSNHSPLSYSVPTLYDCPRMDQQCHTSCHRARGNQERRAKLKLVPMHSHSSPHLLNGEFRSSSAIVTGARVRRADWTVSSLKKEGRLSDLDGGVSVADRELFCGQCCGTGQSTSGLVAAATTLNPPIASHPLGTTTEEKAFAGERPEQSPKFAPPVGVAQQDEESLLPQPAQRQHSDFPTAQAPTSKRQSTSLALNSTVNTSSRQSVIKMLGK